MIDAGQRNLLVAEVRRHMEADESFGPDGRYSIVTQYFDSCDRDCYWEKVHKLQSRRKIRVRLLGSTRGGDAPVAFIEIKHKQNGVGGERQLTVAPDVATRFAGGDYQVLRGMLDETTRGGRMVINEVFDLLDRGGHEPSMQVRFDRSSYVSPDQRFHLSFDTNLACRSGRHPLLPDGSGIDKAILDPGLVVAEVKSTGPVPYWFRQFVADAGLARGGFSKYCVALKEFDPVLRAQLEAGVQS